MMGSMMIFYWIPMNYYDLASGKKKFAMGNPPILQLGKSTI